MWKLVLLLAVGLVVVGCEDRQPGYPSAENPDPYFSEGVATVQAMGAQAYWLGWEFNAGDLVFHGPSRATIGTEVQGGGVVADYTAPLDNGNIPFQLTTYTRPAWDLAKEAVTNPKLRGIARKTVSVQGREGELLFLPGGTRPVNILRLVVDVGDVVLVAEAPSGGPATPGGPDVNPFINNPDLLVQVMQDLRPYPQ